MNGIRDPADLRFRKKKHFETLYPQANPHAIDFLKQTLTCKYLERLH